MSILGRGDRARWGRRGRAAVLALGLLLTLIAGSGTAQAADYKQFTWGSDLRAGDCTMFHGASWTLYPDGTAWFNGLVTSSDDNDAWLMWIDLKNGAGQSMGRIVANTHWDDLTKFVKNLPDHTRQYSWVQMGTYSPQLFAQTQTMTYHC